MDFFLMLAYSASDGSAPSFDFKACAMLASMLHFLYLMTMAMPRVLCESRSGLSLAKVLIGQDRAKNAKFWSRFAVPSS